MKVYFFYHPWGSCEFTWIIVFWVELETILLLSRVVSVLFVEANAELDNSIVPVITAKIIFFIKIPPKKVKHIDMLILNILP